MEVGLFVFGVLVGIGLAWYFLERSQRQEAEAREAAFNARLLALQGEVRESDAALTETKDRLIAMQMESRAVEARAKPLEAELVQAKRAAEQAIEQEMRQRELNAKLQDELQAFRRAPKAKAAPAAPVPALAPAPAADPAPAKRPDDLTAIKGIGKVIEKKLRELGITSFSQIAALTPEDVRRINDAIEFPGRIEREHWIEQARELARA